MSSTASSVSVVGLGSMGSALATAFAAAGHRVTVWNRTWEKAAPLADRARVAGSVLDACAASDLVVVSVLDYSVSNALLRGPETADVLRGRTLVQLSTGLPSQARDAAGWASTAGIAYLDGAIMGYPTAIGTERMVILYAGSRPVFDSSVSALAALGRPLHVGEDAGAAATVDLAMIEVFFGTVASVLHGAALCAREGYPVEAFFGTLPDWLAAVASTFPATQAMVQSGRYSGGHSTMNVNTRAVRHLLEASREAEIDTSLPSTLLSLFQAAVDRGHQDADLPSLYVSMAVPSELSRPIG